MGLPSSHSISFRISCRGGLAGSTLVLQSGMNRDSGTFVKLFGLGVTYQVFKNIYILLSSYLILISKLTLYSNLSFLTSLQSLRKDQAFWITNGSSLQAIATQQEDNCSSSLFTVYSVIVPAAQVS